MNKQILKLAIPNILSNLTVPLLGLVDLAIMGHLDSKVYIGAIGLGGLIFNFLYMGLGFLRMGVSGFTSQALGERNLSEAIVYLTRGLTIAFVFAFVFILIQKPINWLSFTLLEGSLEVEQLASQYFYIRIWAAPAALSVFVFNGWFLGMQNAKFPMIITIAINLVNIGLNFLFVYHFNMKSDGVALATVFAQYTGLIISVILYLVYYKRLNKYWSFEKLKNLIAFKKFVNVNTDILIRTLCIIFVLAFFTSVSAKMGDELLAVNQLLLQFFFIFSYFIDGFANAAEALTGKYVGAKNPKKLKSILRKIFIWGTGLSIPFSIVYYFKGELLLKILTNQTSLIELAKDYYVWVAIIPMTSFVAFIWDGVFIGATASKAMRNTLLLSTFLFLMSYYALKIPLGNSGLWIALNVFLLARGIALSFKFKDIVT